MLRRVVSLLIGFPVFLLLVTIAVANREPSVRLVLDPFNPKNPAIYLDLPLYVWLLLALMAGVALGGAATWFTQSRWRRTARVRTQDAMRWQAEADRLQREREASLSSGKSGAGEAGRQIVPLRRAS